jgi:hypothetical protein
MAKPRDCIVVIPVYKVFQQLDPAELASIRQALLVFSARQIAFAGPRTLDSGNYLEWARSLHASVVFKAFDDTYFRNVDGYNKLLRASHFYQSFTQFEYLLIYQPDCWVFRDELDYWCGRGFDYIGAPWANDDNLEKATAGSKKLFLTTSLYFQKLLGIKKDWRVGNGGFSLRNIKASIRALDKRKTLSSNFHCNEDVYWGVFIPLVYPFFKVPNSDEAIPFCFEAEPERAYIINNRQLPFGCHAWQKYNHPFWSKWIKIKGRLA